MRYGVGNTQNETEVTSLSLNEAFSSHCNNKYPLRKMLLLDDGFTVLNIMASFIF